MNEKNEGALIFFNVETPLHAGTGAGLGAVDLPLQRERMSGLPTVQGSGIKGAWREEFTLRRDNAEGQSKEKLQELIDILFGPEPPSRSDDESDKVTKEAPTWAGAMTLVDARMLLFPVRTVKGGWAWCTSPMLIQRLARDTELLGQKAPPDPGSPGPGEVLVAQTGCQVMLDASASETHVLLEDLQYAARNRKEVDDLAKWLQDRVFPETSSYKPFRERLPGQLVVLADEELRHFAQHGTEVTTRIRMNRDTGTVADGGLWTEESLPAETLLWSMAFFAGDRRPKKDSGDKRLKAPKLKDRFIEAAESCTRIRLGGDRTIGRGIVAVQVSEGGDK